MLKRLGCSIFIALAMFIGGCSSSKNSGGGSGQPKSTVKPPDPKEIIRQGANIKQPGK